MKIIQWACDGLCVRQARVWGSVLLNSPLIAIGHSDLHGTR
jgi:hypothetical protein